MSTVSKYGSDRHITAVNNNKTTIIPSPSSMPSHRCTILLLLSCFIPYSKASYTRHIFYIVRPRVRYKFTPTHSSAIISLQLFVSSIFDWKIPQFVWYTICNILSTNSVHNVPHTPSQNIVGTLRFFRFVCCYMKSIQNVRLSSFTLSNCILFVMISILEFNGKKIQANH